jgi:Putative phage tail protein
MGFLRSGSNSQSSPQYTQVQIQTSSEGLCLPVVYGVNRVAPNLIWMDNFRKVSGSGGKKGGGKGGGSKGNQNLTYTAGVALAVCEGPIVDIGAIYVNNYITNATLLGLGLATGTTTQTPFDAIASPGYVPMAYRNVCYLITNFYDLGSSATVPEHGMEIFGFLSSHVGLPDVNPALIIFDLCTNGLYGLGMPASQIGDQTQFRTYCTALGILMSPALSSSEQAISIFQRWAQLSNSWIFWSENLLKFVPLGDTTVTANGVTYTPITTIEYDLTYEDFAPDQHDPPITVTRTDPSDAYNWVKVEISDRVNWYNNATMEYKDQTSIQKYGLFQANDVQASEICDRGVGATIAGLIGQRAVYIRNTYKFNLTYNFVLLEPGDIVSLTDNALGLTRHPVRIQTVEEDEKGRLQFTAEECPSGSGTAAAIGAQPSAVVALPGAASDPGNVNVPMLIEPPASVTGNAAQVWVGLSGANPLWGGAEVHMSIDDVTYIYAGSVGQASPQGVLLAALPSHADPDTVDTLSIDFTESLQTISSTVTAADADALRSLVLVGNEVMGFGSVVPNGTNSFSYNLTYLRRGAYNTAIAAAANGAPASVLLPASVLKIALPQSYVGQTIYFKFPSFNVFGAGTQDISSVTRYEYVPIGVVYTIAPPSAPALAITTPPSATTISLTLHWTASPGPGLGAYEAQMSADGGITWTAADVTLGASATTFVLAPATANANYQGRVRAVSGNGLAVSAFVTSAVLNAGAAPFPGSMLPLVNGDTPIGIVTNTSGVPIYVVQ